MHRATLLAQKFDSNVGAQRLAISSERMTRLLLHRPSSNSTATASDFSSWVYRAEHRHAFRNLGPPSLLQLARQRISNVLDRLADGEAGDFDLVSCDSGLSTDVIYTSSALRLRGQPLRLRPDVVYRHRRAGVIVIFEYKIPGSDVIVPKEGWPNLASQLWTYAWADPWIENPHVLIVGVAFDYLLGDFKIRAVPRTLKTDPELNRVCRELFLAWGGDIESNCVKDRSLRKLLLASSFN